MKTELRKERHSVSDLKIHLVYVAKYRRPIFTLESLALIEKSFTEVASVTFRSKKSRPRRTGFSTQFFDKIG
jgi:hypothetical protein